MNKLTYVLLILLCISYSCNTKTKKTINEPITTNLSNSKMDVAVLNKLVMNDPNKENIIHALEKAIDFCTTADREEFRNYLNASKAQINSVSDEEFIEIKKDNAYLYENLITSLKHDEASFEILSDENSIFKISFKENSDGSMAVVMSFSHDKDGVLALHVLNTL